MRFIPPGAVVEVTIRTLHERQLLVPDRETTDIVAGIIGRAQALYHVRIHALIVLSNHLQMLLSVRDARQLASFMGYVDGNIAREIGALRNWRQRFWSRRYRAIVVADAQSQIERLQYVFSNSCKEGLVSHPRIWPGVSSARAITTGTEIIGTWHDRTAKRRLTRKNVTPDRARYTQRYGVLLSPIPCLAHLAPSQYRTFCERLIDDVANDAKSERDSRGFAGVANVLSKDPQSRPASSNRTPAPFVHASCVETRMCFREMLDAHTAHFRKSSERMKHSIEQLRFPDGALLPGGVPTCIASAGEWPPAFALEVGPQAPLPLIA